MISQYLTNIGFGNWCHTFPLAGPPVQLLQETVLKKFNWNVYYTVTVRWKCVTLADKMADSVMGQS